jgi:hypothetical protein
VRLDGDSDTGVFAIGHFRSGSIKGAQVVAALRGLAYGVFRERGMMKETIREGFDVFVHDAGKSFGAVREVGPGTITVYVENAGDFTVPLSAVKEVHDQKVILDCGKLDADLRSAIGHAHEDEHTEFG